MNQMTASCPQTDVWPAQASAHDFNIAAMVENNFGQGDDSSPVDPMNDPQVLDVVTRQVGC
jgi:hypothetical protein